jgi:surface carbohydrate biosynthesis protein
MTISPSTLMIPVETQVREMDAKLLLGCIAAERGFPVVIGSRAFIHFMADSIPRGLYLAKSMASLSIRMFDILRKLGHEIVAWEEEALLRDPDPEYFRRRLSPLTMRQLSHLFAWGTDDAETFRRYPGYAGTDIHITGNPRGDLMRPELREFYREDVEALRKRFGDFVLVNTNFAEVNHFHPQLSEYNKAMAKKGTAEESPFDIGKVQHKLALFNYFKEMLPVLCKSVGRSNVVVRPHPTESHAIWNEMAARHDNLYVANDGNIIPWLMATQALVANSCTTQVEAAVLGAPTVNYQPVKSELLDFELPCRVSRCVFTVTDVCATVQDILQGKLGPLDEAHCREVLAPHISALDGPLAAERVVQVLEDEGYSRRRPPATSWNVYAEGLLSNRWRTLSKRRKMRRPESRNSLAYHAHRFPNISVEEIMRKVNRMGRLLNRFEGIRVSEISPYIFRISG